LNKCCSCPTRLDHVLIQSRESRSAHIGGFVKMPADVEARTKSKHRKSTCAGCRRRKVFRNPCPTYLLRLALFASRPQMADCLTVKMRRKDAQMYNVSIMVQANHLDLILTLCLGVSRTKTIATMISRRHLRTSGRSRRRFKNSKPNYGKSKLKSGYRGYAAGSMEHCLWIHANVFRPVLTKKRNHQKRHQ
jgi:hypothetical protein